MPRTTLRTLFHADFLNVSTLLRPSSCVCTTRRRYPNRSTIGFAKPRTHVGSPGDGRAQQSNSRGPGGGGARRPRTDANREDAGGGKRKARRTMIKHYFAWSVTSSLSPAGCSASCCVRRYIYIFCCTTVALYLPKLIAYTPRRRVFFLVHSTRLLLVTELRR